MYFCDFKLINVMKNIIYFLFLLIVSGSSYGQETIDAQRPTLTESNTIVGSKIIQAESGSTYADDSLGFNTFVRFGLNERLEFRMASSFDSPFITFGGKVFISKGDKIIPGLSFALNYNPMYGTQNFVFSATGAPTENLYYTINAGNDSQWWGIALVGYSFGNVSVFGEYKHHEDFSQVHAGVTYVVNGEVQIDINGGVIDNNTPYIGAGVAFRLKPLK